jgi:hypothetical protein
MRARLVLSFSLVSLLLAAGCGAENPSGTANGGAGGNSTTNGTGGAGATGAGGAGGNTGGGGSTSTSNGGNGGTAGNGGGGGTAGNGGSGGSGGCTPGTADCNADAADGCETNTQSDVTHCGACDVVCPGGPTPPPVCNSGLCGLDCADGKGDCNKDVSDGCETNLKTSDGNCGACGLTCMGSPCVQGACACAAETTEANLVQLDLFIMLDQSGSMSDTVQGGATKWSAVTTALKGFFNDPANAGLGVGIQYFALTPGMACTPFCTVDADCGAFGPCVFGVFCAGCSGGAGDSCNAADYSVAAVEIAPLAAGQSSALSSSIDAHSPSTNTPTGPALDGAIKHAKSWAMAHPSHNVVVVLATDGEPTECAPQDIPSIANLASVGVSGNPSVDTFVIGVGPSLDNLNAIAAAGGTGSAFLVDTGANVVQQFKAALNAIQQSALGCEYTIPQPAMGMLDYDKVNVQYTPGNGDPVQLLSNVPNVAACDPATGGWYYDNNAAPTKIILCDATCTPIQGDSMGKVDILLGCATEHI